MLGRACVLLCLAGCDRLFGLTPIALPVDGPPNPLGDAAGDAAGDGGPQCPADYDITLAGSPSRYRYVGSGTTWDIGQITCAADAPGGTHLVVLDDDTERLALFGVLGARGSADSFWIGLSDRRDEAIYLWVTAQEVGTPPPATPPWGAGQPDDQNGAQDCVRIQGMQTNVPGLFDDGECSSIFAFVCECDGYAPDPTRY